MKVAFLFAGQYREISKKLFFDSFSTLINNLDYSVYTFCWKEKGKSLNHSNIIPQIKSSINIEDEINQLFKGFNLVKSSHESFLEFKNNLPHVYKKILNDKKFHYGTVHALPQIYSLAKCYQLFSENKNNYDLIFRCRFDSVFLHPLNLYPLDYLAKQNKIYNLNFGRAYYPKRIYDIFFGGSPRAMSFLNNIWDDLPKLIYHKFNNGLDKRDACRLFYLAASSNKLKCKSFDSRICDIYRESKNNSFEKYIVSSHFSKIKFNLNVFRAYKYLFKWFKYKRIKDSLILYLFLKAFFLIPFSYLKRIKYIKYLYFKKI